MRSSNRNLGFQPRKRRKQADYRRCGTSLLEVLMATGLASMVLVPIASTLVDCSKWTSRTEYQSELMTLTSSAFEDAKFRLAKDFVPIKESSTFERLGYPSIHYDLVCSNSLLAADRDIAGKYFDISITAWADLNSNGVYNQGVEPQYKTKSGFSKP
jgi:hypothetical protein